MDNGWILTHRKIMDCWIWENPLYLKAWLHLLFSANHHDKKIPFDGNVITIERGQFVTSQRKLAISWGCSVVTVRKILKLLESDGMIHTKTDNKKTLVTIVNYDVYQLSETQSITQGITQSITQSITPDITQSITQTFHKQRINELNELNEGNEYLESLQDSCQKVVELYSRICVSFPKLSKLSDSRRKAIKARLKIYSLDDFERMFTKAEASNFLKGSNDRNWSATFDWLMKDANFAKVLDGNYDNRQATRSGNSGTGNMFDYLMEVANDESGDGENSDVDFGAFSELETGEY